MCELKSCIVLHKNTNKVLDLDTSPGINISLCLVVFYCHKNELLCEKTGLWGLTRSDTNGPLQSPKMIRSLKFRI